MRQSVLLKKVLDDVFAHNQKKVLYSFFFHEEDGKEEQWSRCLRKIVQSLSIKHLEFRLAIYIYVFAD